MNQIILETSALGVAVYCLVECIMLRAGKIRPASKSLMNRLRDRNYAYILLLISVIGSAASSVLEMCLETYFRVQGTFVLYLLNEGYFIFHTTLGFLFSVYIMDITGTDGLGRFRLLKLFPVPLVLSQILVISNPLTKWIFFINQDRSYQRGSLLWVLYVLSFFYIVFGITYFMVRRRQVSRLDRLAVIILMSIAVLGIFIQAAFSITVELFFESIAFLGFKLLLEERGHREHNGKYGRISKGSILVLALVFMTVIAMNINLIYHAGTDQTERIGETQLNSVKGEMQQSISESESHLLRYAMGLEQLINDRADLAQIERYIKEQEDHYRTMSDGNCFRAYAASSDWTIIPGFDMPEDYHAKERVWYTGAAKNDGQVYISEPYIDAENGNLCYTFSYILSDGDTVAAMDYTLSRAQDIVSRMSTNEDRFAMIVTDSGMIVGCTDEGYQGAELAKALPEYSDLFDRVRASSEHKSFITRLDGERRIVFSSETNNGWKLILTVDYSEFYSEILNQMILLGAIDVLLVAVIIVFYMVSLNNQARSERTLSTTENFIRSLSEDLRQPLGEILRISERYKRGEDPEENARLLTEAGKRLKETTDSLFAFADVARLENVPNDEERGKKRRRAASLSSRYMRNGIIAILIASLLAGLILCMAVTVNLGTSRIGRDTDRYNNSVMLWMEQKQSILRMFSDVIAAQPGMLEDYEGTVRWLDDIARNYSDMTFAYLANPYNTEHPIIMNNGWEPDPDFHVEDRQWYVETERSGDGYSISAPYYDAQTGMYCITFSRIVYTDDGSFLGIFGIDCLLDKLVGVLADSYSADRYAFMVDRDGFIINHPNKAYEMSMTGRVNIADTGYADVYHDGSKFWMRDYDGRLVACCCERSSLSGFSVIVVQGWWSIYGRMMIMGFVFLTLLAVSIISVARMINRFISWQEETNERLVKAADNAVAAQKEKSRFLAQMSHEIRTPINAVLGMNEMILRESRDESIREYAYNIQTAGKNLLALINSILDFSKIEEGKMEIIPVRYDTALMISNIMNSVQKRAEDKGLVLEAHVDPDLPSALYGDDMRVSQVAVNLLTNAVKYTPEGRIDLYVEKENADEKNIDLRIRVKDTGIGIREEDIGKLFESFTRLEETRNRNIEGTGLGMAIVNRLLMMMDSTLDVKSVYGEGSDFSFAVRQSVSDPTPLGDYEEKIRQLLKTESDDTYLYAPDAKLLVVDDNEMNLKVVGNLLKLNGIKPVLASSGQEMLDGLRAGDEYDIILLDHMMPHMDGIETLKNAGREGLIHENCAVIALTANAVVGARESYLAAGFDDYLSKPVDVASLEAALARFLPQEKVSYRSKSDEDAGAVSGNGRFAGLSDAGLDVESGLKFCGQDEDFYESILSDYLTTKAKREKELDESLLLHDMDSYAIRVHSLKSVSRTIGAADLADIAQSLEKAAKEKDEKKVERLHKTLIRKYEKVADVIREAGISEKDDAASDDAEIFEFDPN